MIISHLKNSEKVTSGVACKLVHSYIIYIFSVENLMIKYCSQMKMLVAKNQNLIRFNKMDAF